MVNFQKNIFTGLVGMGIGAAGGCAKDGPKTDQAIAPTAEVKQAQPQNPDAAATQSFHDYSIPLNLTEVRAEVVYKKGVKPDVTVH